MAIAGKVAITLATENNGQWSADVTYDRLVAVKHNNNLYISRKTVANVEPPNDEFWFLALEGFSGENVEALIDRLNELDDLIQAIIDGTTQVGNAKTLNGHGAEYFAEASKFEFVSMPTGTDLNNCTEQGFYYFDAHACNYPNTPNSDAHNGLLWVYRRSESRIVQIYYSINNGKMYTRAIVGSDIAKWKEIFTTDGGRVTKDGASPLELESTSATSVWGSFYSTLGYLGRLGFSAKETPAFMTTDGGIKELLHTGNKPTGTYTGNGSATERNINIGGTGDFLLIREYDYITIVSYGGGVTFNPSSGTFDYIPKTQIRFGGGILTLATTNSGANYNGVTYTYQVV